MDNMPTIEPKDAKTLETELDLVVAKAFIDGDFGLNANTEHRDWLSSALASYAVYLAGKLPEKKGKAIPGKNLIGTSFYSLNDEWDEAVDTCRAAIMREVEGKE